MDRFKDLKGRVSRIQRDGFQGFKGTGLMSLTELSFLCHHSLDGYLRSLPLRRIHPFSSTTSK